MLTSYYKIMKPSLLTRLFFFWILILCSCQNNKKSYQEENSSKDNVAPSNVALDIIMRYDEEVIIEEEVNPESEEFLFNFKYLTQLTELDHGHVSNVLFYGMDTDYRQDYDYYSVGRYFINTFDRSSENIENFFDSDKIDLIAEVIENSTHYFSSNADYMLSAYVSAYEELKDDQEFLEEASNEKDDVLYRDIIETKYSPKVSNILDFNSYYSTNYKLFKVYAFWVRRHKEGNAQIAYDILKKIKNKLPLRSTNNAMHFRGDKIESQISNDEFYDSDFNTESLNFLINKLDVKHSYFEQFIAENSIFIPRNDEEIGYFAEYNSLLMTKLSEIYSNFDRAPENLEHVFDDKIIDHIAFLFNSGFLDKDQKLYDVIKGLILSYDEMGDEECIRLNIVMTEFQYHDMRRAFDEKCSKEIKDFVYDRGDFEESMGFGSDIDFGHRKRIFYLYSFWLRRHNEGNKEAVYTILKKIEDKIH